MEHNGQSYELRVGMLAACSYSELIPVNFTEQF